LQEGDSVLKRILLLLAVAVVLVFVAVPALATESLASTHSVEMEKISG
jgi:hypothetical protein